jgi:hypothetical protein
MSVSVSVCVCHTFDLLMHVHYEVHASFCLCSCTVYFNGFYTHARIEGLVSMTIEGDRLRQSLLIPGRQIV